jgi:hypothetical protein
MNNSYISDGQVAHFWVKTPPFSMRVKSLVTPPVFIQMTCREMGDLYMQKARVPQSTEHLFNSRALNMNRCTLKSGQGVSKMGDLIGRHIHHNYLIVGKLIQYIAKGVTGDSDLIQVQSQATRIKSMLNIILYFN